MIRKQLRLLALTALVLGTGAANAAVPRMINFQGRLADASGTPVTGSYSIVFSIWNASSSGTACFTETQAVAVNSGLFNANVGSASGGIASGCDFSVPYYLQVQVGSDSPMSPRFALTAAAYALRAQIADDSVKLNGLTQGNAAGQVPSNNGVLQTSLNADLFDGHDWTEIPALISKPVYYCGRDVTACVGTDSYGACITGVINLKEVAVGKVYDGACYINQTLCNSASVPACSAGCTDEGVTSLANGCKIFTTWKTLYTRHCWCGGAVQGYVRAP